MNFKPASPFLLAALAVGLAGCSAPAPAPSAPATASASASAASGGGQATGASSGWQLVPANGAAAIKAAGLQVLSEEGSAEHYHAHLDVLSDGHSVPVPAYIGYSFGTDGQPNGISALHTHDDSGIVHIEAPTAGLTYTLGQVLTEWGVLDGSGGAPGSAHSSAADWQAYVNGVKQPGNPRDIRLKAHDEVLLVHGAAPATIPSSYSFPEGY
ncbi:hypothetical protein [Sinomonas atrocyanea]